MVEHAVSFRCYFLFSCPLLIKLEAKLMDDLHCERPLIYVWPPPVCALPDDELTEKKIK